MKRRNEGVTLIEILIGLSLAAVIVMILLSAMRLGHRSEEKGRQREEVSQRMRIISDRLTWLLRGAYPYITVKDAEKTIYFKGSADRVGFVTTSTDAYAKGPEDTAGLKWVEIFADSDGLKFREKVFFPEDVLKESGGPEYLFDPTVKEIGFEYLDINDEKGTEDWVYTWEPKDKDYLPSAVRMKVSFELHGRLIEMPDIIAGIRAIKKDHMR